MNVQLVLVITIGILLTSCSSDPCQKVSLVNEAHSNKGVFQSEYYALVTSEFPQHKELLEIDYELQRVSTDLHLLRFSYVYKNYPERIDLSEGFNGLMNFGQSDSENETISRANPDFTKLFQKKQELVKQSKKYREQRKQLKVDLKNSPVYARITQLIDDFSLKADAFDQKILACGTKVES